MECNCHRGRTAGVWLGRDFTCQTLWHPPSQHCHQRTPCSCLRSRREESSQVCYSLTPTFCFVPDTVETLGAIGDGGDELMHDLRHRISEVTGRRRVTEFLLQRLNVAIQCGNAANVLGILWTRQQSRRISLLYTTYNCVCMWSY
jgi:hypothetical protein